MDNNIEKSALNSVHIANVVAEKMRTKPTTSLTLTQKKLIFYLISLIQEDDRELKRAEISFADFFKLMEMDYSGKNKIELKKSLEKIDTKRFWISDQTGRYEILCKWLDEVIIDNKKGCIYLKLSETLKPYFLELANKARTIFQLGYILKFKYKYAPDLYLFSSRYKNLNKPVTIRIEDACQRFGEGKYKNLYDLKRRVLEPAIDEINEKSELIVTLNFIKKKNRTTHLVFTIRKKTGQALIEANKWKEKLKQKSVSDQAKELFNEIILNEANECNYVDISDSDSLDMYDQEKFIESRKHMTNKEYDDFKKYEDNDINKALSVNLIEFMKSEYPDRIRHFRSEYRDTEHDSLIFYKDHYHRFSNEDHGNAINYLQKYIGLTFIESLDKLLNFKLLNGNGENIHSNPEKPVKTFFKPINSGDMESIYNYLENRGIKQAKYIEDELGKNKIYATSVKRNGNTYICFSNEEMDFYILKNIKKTGMKDMIVNKNPGGFWYFIPFDDDLDAYEDEVFNVYVCESPIDAISLYRINGEIAVYTAMGGLKGIALEQICKKFSNPDKYEIVLAVDHDRAGNEFCKNYPEFARIVPTLKDWNEDLCAKQSE